MKTLKTCIVGFGPAGAVAAVGLARQGHSVRVYERDANPFEIEVEAMKDRAYPVIIPSKGAEVMASVGMLSYFQKLKYCNEFRGHNSAEGTLVDIDQTPVGYQGSRNGIMKTLYEALTD